MLDEMQNTFTERCLIRFDEMKIGIRAASSSSYLRSKYELNGEIKSQIIIEWWEYWMKFKS